MCSHVALNLGMGAGFLRLGFRERTNIALDVMPLNIENHQAFHRHYPRTVILQLGFKPLFGIVIVLVLAVVEH
jgi:hypothetical protein